MASRSRTFGPSSALTPQSPIDDTPYDEEDLLEMVEEAEVPWPKIQIQMLQACNQKDRFTLDQLLNDPRRMLERVDLDRPDPTDGDTLMMAAARREWVTGAELLREHGANPAVVPATAHFGPLHIAVLHNDARFVQWLISTAKVPVDQRTPSGSTALYLATRRGHLEMVEHLVAHGADTTVTLDSSDGKSPQTLVDIARQNGHGDIAAFFERPLLCAMMASADSNDHPDLLVSVPSRARSRTRL